MEKKTYTPIVVKVNRHLIYTRGALKYLGVMLDKHLNFVVESVHDHNKTCPNHDHGRRVWRLEKKNSFQGGGIVDAIYCIRLDRLTKREQFNS